MIWRIICVTDRTLRYIILHYASLSYTMPHSTTPRYTMLHYPHDATLLHYAIRLYTTPHSPTLCHTILHYSHYAKLFCTTLYDSTLRPTLLHYATLSYTKPRYSTQTQATTSPTFQHTFEPLLVQPTLRP